MLQSDLAQSAGVSRQTVVALEKGGARARMPAKIGSIEQALGWAPHAAAKIAGGMDLEQATSAGAPPAAAYAEGMPLRVIRELSDGQVVDTDVLDLTLPGSNSKLVVVFKRDSPAADMDPSQLRRDLEEWSRIQRAVRQVTFTPRPESDADQA